jgi:hypothetical protein
MGVPPRRAELEVAQDKHRTGHAFSWVGRTRATWALWRKWSAILEEEACLLLRVVLGTTEDTLHEDGEGGMGRVGWGWGGMG